MMMQANKVMMRSVMQGMGSFFLHSIRAKMMMENLTVTVAWRDDDDIIRKAEMTLMIINNAITFPLVWF